MAVSKGNSIFSGKLHEELKGDGVNVIFSPYSITNVFALVNAGAGGKTKEEINNSFGFTENVHDEFKAISDNIEKSTDYGKSVTIANKVFAQIGKGFELKEEYVNVLTNKYGSGMGQVDFGNAADAADTINKFVEDTTKGKIQKLITPDALNDMTRLVLVNAIHFKGSWMKKFDVNNTRNEDFNISPTEKVIVPIMRHNNKRLNAGVLEEFNNMKVLELPYDDGRLSMFVFLPEGFGFTMPSLTPKELMEKMHEQQVNLTLPKFKIEATINLKSKLNKLGINEAFSPNADFTGISDTGLSISAVIQKATIEVNEEGAEAAAATGVIMMMRCMPFYFDFYVDKPFGYQIVDKELDLVLFEGRVGNPSAES